jgi:hypothetical protein
MPAQGESEKECSSWRQNIRTISYHLNTTCAVIITTASSDNCPGRGEKRLAFSSSTSTIARSRPEKGSRFCDDCSLTDPLQTTRHLILREFMKAIHGADRLAGVYCEA